MKIYINHYSKFIALAIIACMNTVWTKAANDFDPYIYDTMTYDGFTFSEPAAQGTFSYSSFTYVAPSGNGYQGIANHVVGESNIRLTNSSSSSVGIVTTNSIGYIREVSVVWGPDQKAGNQLYIHTKDGAYNSSTDLYSTKPATRGNELSKTIEATVADEQDTPVKKYVGLKASASMLFSKIIFKWQPAQYTRQTTPGRLGTICLPFSVESTANSGGKFFEVAGKVMDGDIPVKVVFNEVTSLTQGNPYVFLAEADAITLNYTPGGGCTEAASVNGLCGTFVNYEFSEDDNYEEYDYFIINGSNEIQAASKQSGADPFRAFIKMSDVPEYNPAASQVNVRRLSITGGGFSLEEPDLTNIEQPETAVGEDAAAIFTLGGSRINDKTALPRGCYIKEGKKYIIR